jgi:hypothetical protein
VTVRARGPLTLPEGGVFPGTRAELAEAEEISRVADAIATDQRRRDIEAICCLWRTGDVIRGLRDRVPAGTWRYTLNALARHLNVSAASLDDAVRVAQAFPEKERETLLRRFEEARAELLPSHVIVIARVAARRRACCIDMLLRRAHTVQELRTYLRLSCSETVPESTNKTGPRMDGRRIDV